MNTLYRLTGIKVKQFGLSYSDVLLNQFLSEHDGNIIDIQTSNTIIKNNTIVTVIYKENDLKYNKMNMMKKRILNTLEGYLLVNREVMPEEEIKDLEEQIEAVINYF
jgi:hypothetical protein